MKPKPHAKTLALAIGSALMLPASATLYWDVNGTLAGSGNNGGIWSTTDPAYWTTDPDGLTDNSATVFTDGEGVVFSAGTDGTGTWTVLVSGTVATPSITFEEAGTQTISAGTIDLTGGLTIDSNAVADTSGNSKTIASKLTGTGNLTLALNGDLSATGGGSTTYFTLSSTTSDFTGDLTVTSGLLNWTTDAALGAAANKIVLNGGGIIDPGLNRTSARSLEVGPAGGTIRVYGSTTNTLTGPLTSSAATTLKKTEGGTLVIQGSGSGFTGTIETQGGNTVIESANWANMDYVNTLTTAGSDSGFRSGTLTTINSLTTSRNVYLFNNTGLDVDSGTVNFGQGAAFWVLNNGANTGAYLTSSSGTLTVNGGTTNTGTLATADQQIRVLIQDFNGSTPLTLVKNNDNILILNQSNTYSGGTTVNGGRLQAQHAAAMGAGTVTVNNGGQVMLELAGATYANNFVINGNGIGETAGTLGAIRFQNNTVSGSVTVASASRIGAYGGATATITGALLGSADLEINGGGLNSTVNLTGNATLYNGTLTLSTGTLNATSVGGGLTVNAGTANMAAIGGNLTVNTGTVTATTIGGSLTVDGGTANVSGAVTGAVVLGGGTLNLNNGASTVGAPNFQVLGGTLNVNTGATVNGAVATGYLNPLTVNLAGTIAGTLTIDDANTLGLRGGSIGGGLILGFDGASANTLNYTSPLAVTGNLTVHGTHTVNLVQTPAPGGPATILTYTGTASDPDDTNVLNNFILTGAANFRTATFANTGSAITLDLSAQNSNWVGGDLTNPSFWDVGAAGTPNWTSSDNRFYNGDGVTFGDTASSFTVDMRTAGIAPYSIVFNNSTNAYTVTSTTTGYLTGSTSITKNGTATTTLGGANGQNFTGPIAVNAGILKMGSRDAFGLSSGITVANNAQVDINGQTPGTVATGGYTYSIIGDGVGATGAIVNTGAGVASNAGVKTLNLTGNASLGVVAGSRFDVGFANLAGAGTINGNGFTLTKKGDGQIAFRGDASGSAINYVIEAGTAWAENTGNAFGGATGTLTIKTGARAGTYGALTVPTPVTIETGGTLHNQGGGNGTWSGAITMQDGATIETGTQIFITGTATHTGTGAIAKTGGAQLTVTGALVGSGTSTLNVNANILQIGNVGATGSISGFATINLANGVIFRNRLSGASNTINSNFTFANNASELRQHSGGANDSLTLTGTIGTSTTTGILRPTFGRIILAAGSSTTVNMVAAQGAPASGRGTIEVQTGATLTAPYFNIGQDTNNSGIVNVTGGTVTVPGGGTGVRIGHWNNGSATIPSELNVTAGTFDASATNVTTSIGWDGYGIMTVGGGANPATAKVWRIQADSNGDSATYNDTITLLSNGTLEVGAGGTLGASANDHIILKGGTLTGTANSTWAARMDAFAATTSALGASAGVTATATGALTGTGTINKVGDGTVVLSNLATFAGSSTVTAGTLSIAAANTHAGTVTVNTAGRLGAGATSAANSVGTLTLGTATIDGTIVLDLDAGGLSANSDQIAAGTLIFGAGSKIAPRFNGAATIGVLQSYTLMTYSGTLTGTPTLDNQFYADFRPPTTSLNLGAGSNSSITLDVTFNTGNLFWSGTPANSNWDVNTSLNWDSSGVANEKFYAGDNVTFDNFGNNTNPINLVATLTPGLITVDSDIDYTFQGAGAIGGTTALTKSGTGKLTLLTDNTYTGAVTITGGTVQVGNGGTTGTLGGTGAISVNSGAELAFNRSDALAPGRAFTGGGTVSLTGGASLTTVANNSTDFVVNAGTLFARGGDWATSWSANRAITIRNGGTLDTITHSLGGLGGATRPSTLNIEAGGAWTLNNEQYIVPGSTNLTGGTIQGAGEIRGGGTITHTGDVTSTIASRTNLAGTIIFDVADGAQPTDLNITGTVTGTAGLTKNNTGTLALAGPLSAAGTITVNDGLLALRMPGTPTVANALAGTGGTIANETTGPLILSGSGSTYAGTIDANGKPVHLLGTTSGSGTGGTITLEGASLNVGLYQTEGLLFSGTFAGAALDTTPLPNTSAVVGTAAGIQGTIAATTTIALDGEIYLPAGTWSFVESVDDGAYVNINGTTVLNNTVYNATTTGTFTSAGGWYPITLRVHNNTGGAGPFAPFTYSIGIQQGDTAGSTDAAAYVPFEIGALGTKCRVTGPAGTVVMAGGLTTGGGVTNTVNTQNGSLTITGPLAGSDPLAKTGTGTLTLNGTATLTNTVTVQQGTLLLGTGSSLASAASVTVNSGATLAGTGTSAATTVNGSLSPGVGGIGAMSSTGTLAFGPSSVFSAEINSNGTPTADKVTVTGNVTIDPTTSVIFSDLGSTVLTPPVKLVLIEYTGTLSGTFAGRAEGSNVVIGGNTFVIRYADTVGPNKGVTLSIGGDYDSWATFYSLTGPNALRTADPDGDGATNEEEYAFGLVPTSGASVSPITLGLSKTAGTFTYTRRDDALTGLTYKVWTSPDLATWTEDNTATSSVTAAGQNEVVQVTLSAAKPLAAPKLFVRVSYQ